MTDDPDKSPVSPAGGHHHPGLLSIRYLFLLAMTFLIIVLSVPLLISGTNLMGKVAYQFGTEILSDKLASLVRPVTERYAKLRQIGLEDSEYHREQIRQDALRTFASYRYKRSGTVFVVSRDKEILLSPDFKTSDTPDFPAFFAKMASSSPTDLVSFEAGGVRKLAACIYFPEWNSFVGLGIDEGELLAERQRFIQINVLVLAIVILLAVLLTLGLQRLIITPLLRLADYTSEIVTGKYHSQIQGKFILELNVLKKGVSNMVCSLLQKMRETENQLEMIRKSQAELGRALKALTISEERLQAVLDNTTSVIFLKDREGRYLAVNKQFEALFHVSRETIKGKTDRDIFPLDMAVQFQENDRRVLARNGPIEFEEQAPHDDGIHTYISVKFPLHDEKGAIYAVCAIATDITNRKQAEEELAAEQERLAITLRSIGDGVITTDMDGKVVLLNKVAEELTGWSQREAAGKPITEVFNIISEKSGQRCEAPVREAMKEGHVVGLANHTVLIARGGRERSIADSAAPIFDRESKIIGAVLVFRDVTEKLKTEAELLKAKKLESIGVLAGGVAHDFNNILVAILGNISLARALIEPDSAAQVILENSEKASLKAKNLTQQLLTFAKGGEPIKETASIVEVITDSAEFLLHGGKVKCNYAIPEDLWLVEIDKGQMSQVIQNLIMNADQAMPHGGVIDIACENVTLAGGKSANLPAGRYVKISVRDQGIGIAEQYLDKIFDPYFSLKEKGSGLGLAITHSIISKHGGRISAQSTEGEGAEFTIYLPAAGNQAVEAGPAEAALSLRGEGSILLMDDDEMVRDITNNLLTHYGYTVFLAADGAEALEKYRAALAGGNPIDVVVMDLTIPGGMGGKEAIGELLRIDPAARVIVSSGYSNDPVMSNYHEFGFKAAVSKPYQSQDLIAVIKRLTGE